MNETVPDWEGPAQSLSLTKSQSMVCPSPPVIFPPAASSGLANQPLAVSSCWRPCSPSFHPCLDFFPCACSPRSPTHPSLTFLSLSPPHHFSSIVSRTARVFFLALSLFLFVIGLVRGQFHFSSLSCLFILGSYIYSSPLFAVTSTRLRDLLSFSPRSILHHSCDFAPATTSLNRKFYCHGRASVLASCFILAFFKRGISCSRRHLSLPSTR